MSALILKYNVSIILETKLMILNGLRDDKLNLLKLIDNRRIVYRKEMQLIDYCSDLYFKLNSMESLCMEDVFSISN